MKSKAGLKIIIFFAVLFAIFTSCRFNSKLNNKQKAWIPYKGNEILVFQSNLGAKDTLLLAGRDTFFTTDTPLVPFGKRFQCQRLFSKYLRHNDSSMTYVKGTMMQLTRLANGDAELYLSIQTRAGGFFSDEIFTIRSLNKLETEIKTMAGRTFADVVVFSARATGIGEADFPHIQKIWWSKQTGMVMYSSNQGEVWTLKKQ